MNRLIAFLVDTFGLLRPSVYAPIYCDGCATHRGHITRAELAVLLVHHRLLCSCGGYWTYIGPDREEVRP